MHTTCEVSGCRKPAVSKGLCDTHRKRRDRHGHVFDTRPANWGAKDKHPLYGSWVWMRRKGMGLLCEEWEKDFWKFVEYMGERPSSDHIVFREDESKPYGPGNTEWRINKFIAKQSEDYRRDRREYMREWRKRNPEQVLSRELVRHYGITLEQYLEMHDAQNGVCAVCSKPETTVDNRTKEVRRLAVDHCHSAGKIRSLLCSRCNTVLGQVGDDTSVLAAMVGYLKSHA